MQERTGEATLLGNPLTVVGAQLRAGDQAPDFTLIDFDPQAMSMSGLGPAQLRGTTAILNVVVSLDTPVCHVQTKRFESEVAQIPGVEVLTISKDLPFAQARWKAAEGVSHKTLSAYQDDRFATDYGVLLKEPHLLQRSIFVIGPDGRLRHTEYVAEQTQEPNYAAALDAARLAKV